MHKIIETIRDQEVPIHSAVAAAQHLGLSGIGELSVRDYKARIKEITTKDVSYDKDEMYRMVYGYLVTEAIKESNHTDKLDAEVLYTTAVEKATKLVKDNAWMFAKAETEERLDNEGNVKPKKGAKKELAKKVYNEQIKDKITSRKEAIEVLVKEVGLTPAGASTYYANLKSGKL